MSAAHNSMTPNRDQADLIERLKEAAAKATPGPYTVTTCCDYWLEAGGKGIAQFGELSWCGAETTINDQSEMEANARFHALCSPENVLSLIDRLATTQSALDEARGALEPFARADKALGDEPGPFRFETANGHRLIEREDFRRARAATRTAGGDNGE